MKTKLIAFLMTMMLSSFAMANCEVPEKPEIPDGKSASAAEMFKAKKAVDAYVKAGEAVLQSCRLTDRRQNIVLSDIKKIASEFNRNLKVYKERA